MKHAYIVRSDKVVTVSDTGTLEDGALVVKNGKIMDVDYFATIKKRYSHLNVVDMKEHTITPGLVDCHTHLLEFAPAALYPVTEKTFFLAGKSILLKALSSGITALGEQICGNPNSYFSIDDYRKVAKDIPMDISFALTSISIGLPDLLHFTSITKSTPVTKGQLLDTEILRKMATHNDYPGENIFINATPANFKDDEVPRAGEIIYTLEELEKIVQLFHSYHKKIGVHVAEKEGIKMAIEAGVDVLHHAHDIDDALIDEVVQRELKIVATPLGGTHTTPNSPDQITTLVEKGIPISIATDAYLPPSPLADWLPYTDDTLKGPDELMRLSYDAMTLLAEQGYDENDILALITANPADILEKGNKFGRLKPGMDANFLVAEGIPGLEITNPDQIKKVFFQGIEVIHRN